MNKVLKVGHFVGLAVFLGSIPGHIVLGQLGDPILDPAGFAVLMHAKYITVLVLTMPGLIIMLLTGIALMLRRGMTPDKFRWMAAKLLLVGLIALNGVFVLRPLGRDIATAAQGAVATGSLTAIIPELARKESAFGAINLAMILAVIGLAVAKPSLRKSAPRAPAEAATP